MSEPKELTPEEKRQLGIEELAALSGGMVFDKHTDPTLIAIVAGIVLHYRIDPKKPEWYKAAHTRIDDLILLAAEDPKFRDEPTIGVFVRRLAAAVHEGRKATS